MQILAAALVVTATLACLGLATLLTILLVHQWKSNSETMRTTLDLSDTAKEMTRWNKSFAELLRSQDSRLATMEVSQRALADAIYSVPAPHRSAAKEALAKMNFGPTPGTVELPTEADLLAKSQAPKEKLTSQEIAVGKPI